MNILFDINHPAHVHLFRHFIAYLRQQGHGTVILGRHKDITTQLLDHYGLEYVAPTRAGGTRLDMARELILRDRCALRLQREHRFGAAFGTSATIAHLTLLAGVPSYNFCEDDDDVVPLYAWLAYPFTTAIVNPSCLRFRRWRRKRILHNSYQKLAYLHPDQFRPDVAVLERYGLKPRQYVVLRLSAMRAHHDFGQRGLTPDLAGRVVQAIAGCTVVRSQENGVAQPIAPWDMHHVLAFARMLVADSQTMAVEAAVLGTPSVRYSTFAGRLSCLDELEHRYGLTRGFAPGAEGDMLAHIGGLLGDPATLPAWQVRRRRLLAEKVPLTPWMIDLFERRCGRAAGSGPTPAPPDSSTARTLR
jgi:predicted glycosyltransferase